MRLTQPGRKAGLNAKRKPFDDGKLGVNPQAGAGRRACLCKIYFVEPAIIVDDSSACNSVSSCCGRVSDREAARSWHACAALLDLDYRGFFRLPIRPTESFTERASIHRLGVRRISTLPTWLSVLPFRVG